MTIRPLHIVPALLLAWCAAACLPAAAPAQEDGAPVAIGVYRVIESEILGETRRLLIHLPVGYEGSAVAYPVVYHTYGDYLYGYYAQAVATLERLANEARIPPLILVGVDNIDRYRDLRPVANDGSPTRVDLYTRFLVEEVFPFVQENYRTASFRLAVGPQAGAVFCLHTLLENPGLFDAFILNNPLTSPPNTEVLLPRAETAFAARPQLKKFFFITYGGIHETPEMVQQVRRLGEWAEPLRAGGFDLRLHDVGGNDDFIPPLALEEGLRALFADYHVPPDRTFADLAEIRTFCDGLSGRYGYAVAPPEHLLTRTSDALLQAGRGEAALEILNYQTALYPRQVNGWWRLAGMAEGRGDVEEAIRLLRKCVEINPGMTKFVERRINALQKGE